MKTTKKYKFRIYKGSDMHCKLTIRQDNNGYLRWYNQNGELSSDQMESLSNEYIKEMIRQAEFICKTHYAKLVSY